MKSTRRNDVSLQEILTIENDSNVFSAVDTDYGVQLWPLIRVAVIRTIMSDLLYSGSAGLVGTGRSNVNYRKRMLMMAHSWVRNMSLRRKLTSKIVIMSSGLGNIQFKNRTFDRINGHFASIFDEETIMLDQQSDGTIHSNYEFQRVLLAMPSATYHRFKAKIFVRQRHRSIAAFVIENVVSNSLRAIDFSFSNVQKAHLIAELAIQLASLPFVIEHYADFFSRNNTKLLVKEDACYGGSSVAILFAAKLANVTTAEIQHGVISAGHDGYNVGSTLANSREYQNTLPDYLLIYGNWWGAQCNVPVRKIAIGNPHRDSKISEYSQTFAKSKITLLLLGDGIETDEYLNLAALLVPVAAQLGLIVKFRPHPIERGVVSRKRVPRGVQLDYNEEIYETFFESKIVVSELSTGLFEAVGISETIVLWETKKSRFAFPILPFRSFGTIDELKAILTSETKDELSVATLDENDFWAKNWRENYENFIREVLL